MPIFKFVTCWMLLLLFAGAPTALAENVAKQLTIVDRLEIKLEISRHERLAMLRTPRSVKLSPFESDGCSGGQTAGWQLLTETVPALAKRHGRLPPWQDCCVVHDRAYHAGGGRNADAMASFEARRLADERLRQCVIRTGERRIRILMTEYGLSREQVSWLYRRIADAMYRAVRLGGAPCTGLSWRWGFGWPHCD